ncbi:hypothetical protein ES708_31184 [subsurface metagenome]
MIKWISQAAGHGLCPLLELLIITRIAGAVAFGHTIGSHCPPFVVVAVKPNLGQILELMVVGDLLSRQVAVIIVDRHLLDDPPNDGYCLLAGPFLASHHGSGRLGGDLDRVRGVVADHEVLLRFVYK